MFKAIVDKMKDKSGPYFHQELGLLQASQQNDSVQLIHQSQPVPRNKTFLHTNCIMEVWAIFADEGKT